MEGGDRISRYLKSVPYFSMSFLLSKVKDLCVWGGRRPPCFRLPLRSSSFLWPGALATKGNKAGPASCWELGEGLTGSWLSFLRKFDFCCLCPGLGCLCPRKNFRRVERQTPADERLCKVQDRCPGLEVWSTTPGWRGPSLFLSKTLNFFGSFFSHLPTGHLPPRF